MKLLLRAKDEMKWEKGVWEQPNGLHVSWSDRRKSITSSFSSSRSHPQAMVNAAACWIISAMKRIWQRMKSWRTGESDAALWLRLSQQSQGWPIFQPDWEGSIRKPKTLYSVQSRLGMFSQRRPLWGLSLGSESPTHYYLTDSIWACNLPPHFIEKSRFDVTNPGPKMTNKSGICLDNFHCSWLINRKCGEIRLALIFYILLPMRRPRRTSSSSEQVYFSSSSYINFQPTSMEDIITYCYRNYHNKVILCLLVRIFWALCQVSYCTFT